MIDRWLAQWERETGSPRQTPVAPDRVQLRRTLIEEEFDEVMQELERPNGSGAKHPDDIDRAKLAKELADLVYVVFGTAYAFDIPLEAVVAEVHKSNMSKIEGGIKRRSDGKIEKGPAYREADVQKVLDLYDKLSDMYDGRTERLN